MTAHNSPLPEYGGGAWGLSQPGDFDGADRNRAWIERHERYVVVAYWPEIMGDGRPVRLSFRNVTEAREFVRLNLSGEVCVECYSHGRVSGGQHCVECERTLAALRDLERRHKQAEAVAAFKSKTWERLSALKEKYDGKEFTAADKAAVLDLLMDEAQEVA